MSILIKGMETPTSCGDCRFCGGIADTDCGPCAWCDVDGKARVADTRQDCPLVPVPPHGRLIDADAVEKQIDYVANLDWNKKVGASGGMLAALEIVEDAPTIIQEEEGEI